MVWLFSFHFVFIFCHLFLLNSNLDFSISAPKWQTFSYSFEFVFGFCVIGNPRTGFCVVEHVWHLFIAHALPSFSNAICYFHFCQRCPTTDSDSINNFWWKPIRFSIEHTSLNYNNICRLRYCRDTLQSILICQNILNKCTLFDIPNSLISKDATWCPWCHHFRVFSFFITTKQSIAKCSNH